MMEERLNEISIPNAYAGDSFAGNTWGWVSTARDDQVQYAYSYVYAVCISDRISGFSRTCTIADTPDNSLSLQWASF
jgi:hypothetical protein